MGEFDVVIHGGRVIDGTGNPWVYADVAIKDGKIAAIGKINPASGTRSARKSNRERRSARYARLVWPER